MENKKKCYPLIQKIPPDVCNLAQKLDNFVQIVKIAGHA